MNREIDLNETIKTVIKITERHEKQLKLAAEIARIELARRRQSRNDRTTKSKTRRCWR